MQQFDTDKKSHSTKKTSLTFGDSISQAETLKKMLLLHIFRPLKLHGVHHLRGITNIQMHGYKTPHAHTHTLHCR